MKSKIPEVLERPSNFKLIWETNSVSIYQMEAPVGYTCLGGIARSRGGIERLTHSVRKDLTKNASGQNHRSL